ncbi:nuclear transport factor 2 family protein [Billgrantia diversa]|uniref:nuclear transport factor 2 family protein n=1 Tax=Halomonas sp. MCCC 1A13316 TaxID=2733487 RepID=UPI0018A52ED7|nr:nuclear transport factor 2 family protein [Halomonas sp. MCCC 1A13316]QOR40199.1 nuclear transport factor 2 family protein [Halomonas sp. MCCC 1A13316]
MHRDDSLEAFCVAFNKLDKDCTKLLYELYTRDVLFIDPFHRIEGIDALEAHFSKLYENVTACRFTFHDRLAQGNHAYVIWTMHLRHPRLGGGKPVTVEGCSQLTFSAREPQRVCQHRDYFDAGAMLYEQLPGLGSLVRWLKRRI